MCMTSALEILMHIAEPLSIEIIIMAISRCYAQYVNMCSG